MLRINESYRFLHFDIATIFIVVVVIVPTTANNAQQIENQSTLN